LTVRSQQELDAEFTLDSIGDLNAVVARRKAAAMAADEEYPSIRAIPYGDGAAETLHLFLPRSAAARASVQMFIHGGFWMSMSAADFSFLARGFVPFGIALALLDYPLIPSVRLGDIVGSCRRAVAFMHRQGRAHGINPDRIFISGNSAGGHLVAELLDRAWTRASRLPGDVIKGGAAISGLYDLRPVAASFRNADLHLDADEVTRFSPLRRRPQLAAPTIAAVGGDEMGEFQRQTADFAALARNAGAPMQHMVLPGTNHITVILDALAGPAAALNQAVRQQIEG
jgi:arylformamidase